MEQIKKNNLINSKTMVAKYSSTQIIKMLNKLQEQVYL